MDCSRTIRLRKRLAMPVSLTVQKSLLIAVEISAPQPVVWVIYIYTLNQT